MGSEADRIMEVPDIILFGLGRYGRSIAENLLRRGKKVLAVDFDPQVVAAGQSSSCLVRYGDAEDPELLENLPLKNAAWVVNTIPGGEANLSLLKTLRDKGYGGKVVLTAHNQKEAEAYRSAGADKVLWPFVDAAEQAVDYLTASREELSALALWPLILEEVKIRQDSAVVGKNIGDLALRTRTGVSVVAVDRAGDSHFDPDADFQLFPGDRFVLLGTQDAIVAAQSLLEEPRRHEAKRESGFQMTEIVLTGDSEIAGKTLRELNLRQRYGISVIGIQRGEERVISPHSEELLKHGDIILVLGRPEAIQKCRERPWDAKI